MVRFSVPKSLRALVAGCLSLSVGSTLLADDLRDAAPPGAYMAIYGMHNAERDYQRPLYEAVWKEVQTTKLVEKVLQLVQGKMGEGDAEQFATLRDAFRAAIAPIEWDKLANTKEALYTQKFQGPMSVHLLMLRIPDGGADSLKTAIVNLFGMAATASNGQVPVVSKTIAGVEMQSLQLPGQLPFPIEPSVGVKDDVLVITTSLAFAQEGLQLLSDPSAVSKFDDPRVTEALSHLPKPEDSLIFFDGKAMAEQLQQIPGFIETVSNGNPEAQRVADLMSDLMHQMDAFDYEVTVEYTDGFQNRTSSFGRYNATADETVIGKMLGHQKPFENWAGMVPATATGFSLSGGGTLLPMYEWLMEEIPAKIPEAQQGLDQFAAVQDQIDLHLKEDLLEAFSGEMASITLPGAPTPFGKGSQSVLMLRCSKPERIQELMHRGMNLLNDIPQVKAQGIGLKDAAGLEGFEELTAQFFGMVGIRPVIGFRDGWMIFGSHAAAVETAFAAQSGDAANWGSGDRFAEFGLTIDGTVNSIKYENTGENIRNLAQGLQQAGVFAPMLIGMAQGQNQGGNGPDLAVVQEALSLLPSVARVIGKMDFIDATVTVSQPGSESGSYTRDSVTLIKPPQEKKAATSGSKNK